MKTFNNKKVVLFFIALFTFASISNAQENQKLKFDLSGFFKAYFAAVDPVHIKHSNTYKGYPPESNASNHLRLSGVWKYTNRFRGEIAYVASYVSNGSSTSSSSGTEGSGRGLAYRVTDTNKQFFPQSDQSKGRFYVNQNLDRLFVTFSPDFADISIGRQPIVFGSGKLFPASDVLAPFALEDLDTENRIGVDAARMRIPLGLMSELDMGAVFGEDFNRDKSAFFIRGSSLLLETNLTITNLLFKDNYLIGFDATRSLGGASTWFDAAYVFAKVMDKRKVRDDFFRMSTGLDYNFNVLQGLYTYLEYHYNGASTNDPSRYLLASYTDTAYTDAGVFLAGRHYIVPGISLKPSALIDTAFMYVYNISDKSSYIHPEFHYGFSENTYLEFGAYIAAGKKASEPVPGYYVPEDEFGIYSSYAYSVIKLYF
jgi:hypothetical protein